MSATQAPGVPQFRLDAAPMPVEQGPELVMRFAEVLHANGESTDDTLSAADQLGKRLRLCASLVPAWDDLHLRVRAGGVSLASIATAAPTGINMDRVAAATRAIDAVRAGALTLRPPPARRSIPFRERQRHQRGCSHSLRPRAQPRCR